MKGEFVILECGCKIIKLEDQEFNIMLWPCDLDREECHKNVWFHTTTRSTTCHEKKVRRPMTLEEIKEFSVQAGHLIHDGYRMKDLRSIIGVKAS